MTLKELPLRTVAMSFALGLVTIASASLAGQNAGAAAGSPDSGKIPVTTASDAAKKEFLQGRELAEKLQAQDSIQHFDKAISLDPDFALAELSRANAGATPKEFFGHLQKAVALSQKASDGERSLILATEAGANGDATTQKRYLEQLVAAYPRDERAHFNLGGYYFGQQDFAAAIEHYKKATELAPSYSPAYNILGYAYRQRADYANAEQAFKKYIELIPKDPNPYDSYAELLLKMGRFQGSLAQYAKALAIDSNFLASHVGRAADFMYMGKTAEASSELDAITKKARSDGDRRTALFGRTVLAVDGEKWDEALAAMDQQYAIAKQTKDDAAMAGDLQTKGQILLEMGKYDEAKAAFAQSLKVTEGSGLSDDIKKNARLFEHFNNARIALGRNDLAGARTEVQAFRSGAETSRNPAFIRQAHELAGIVALQEKKPEVAIAELEQASNQNPYNLYRLCLAYQAKGDSAKAGQWCGKAAKFNSLPQLNFAFIRGKAAKLAGGPTS
jgi:tetratricopeptide (TPR) repeat protein